MSYDVVVIGSGPGGYICAIRCAQLGLKTAIVEKYKSLGGTCLNVGCIPSKALLDSSEHYFNAVHHFMDHGISTGEVNMDAAKMFERKKGVVDTVAKGVSYLMSKNKIEVLQGIGSFINANSINVVNDAGENLMLESKYFVIATGSKPITPAAFNYDKKRVITSTEALSLGEIPKSMVVIGAGVIGLELGSVYARLGTKVDVVEFTDKCIGTMDMDCGKELQKVLKKEGFTFHLNHAVTTVKSTKNKVTVEFKQNGQEEVKKIDADYCLVAIGRRPYTDGLHAEAAGVLVDEKGRIDVDGHLRTTVPNIFAVGDVVKGAMLAHKAEEEGVFVAETIAGQRPHINYNLIPGVVYTWPEVAAVGETEAQLKDRGVEYKVGKFPFKALGRAKASGDEAGFVKVLADKTTDEILGVHMIGPRAADLIAEAVVAMEYRASAEDIGIISHAHPTYSEAFKEAALDATGKRALNI
ncbi:MAG: dihydrolipoyl dehydrogenase [Saprospiraceae bacterium]|jgi:dihydrolipoamide dehydrogenase|uniref:dihydrolipoyl dehydrogenase n=1 Tax=Candidatus Brachybacter algidus TaxID=2982024 RepID=UPI001B6D64AC|nr:dihydrolipoyl dehydrogenase [Candidatus Brachybacter algidus]MBP7306367.1 dihydrolipoyl dehydrogenase [Saprospiraceae bacterium]MBK6448964.1 dihydrolipoyl dehydrogenase [Candidatus Brachybacter algidus]MBK7605629.1 dihydrolipoyl dehydrogenase [Candidatus Brachybacter algidus]MBK8357331.1 dihydrolipoyl dehydrogenase [Candidatus Brachybacter algidus]MBK8604753.1 dihydrolipoyl dehydrogenase [Candidatus Brachybacter algidus]